MKKVEAKKVKKVEIKKVRSTAVKPMPAGSVFGGKRTRCK